MTSSAREIARALGGDLVGGAILCPGPGHSARDRSLRVWIGLDGPRVHSFAGDDWRDCLDHVRERLGLEPFAPEKQEPHRRHQERDRKAAVDRLDEEAKERAKAAFTRELVRRIWREAGSCSGTLAQDYLRSRKIDLDDDLTPRVLRFHPRVQFGPKAQAEFHPALLAAYTPIEGVPHEDNPVSLHRIALTPNAEKIGKGMALGSNAGCVIRLSADEDVTLAIGLAEGAETGLSILMAGWRPMWVCGGTSTLAKFPLLSGITSLSVFADHDASGAGLRAAREVVSRYRSAGRWTDIVMHRERGRDWADAWSAR